MTATPRTRWTKENIVEFRKALGLRPDSMARLVGVATNTFVRWEDGGTVPTGPPDAVMTGLWEAWKAAQGAPWLRDRLRQAAHVGGLPFLLMDLLKEPSTAGGRKKPK